jgi:chromosome segregation ATPase
MTRISFDLSPELHQQFKLYCAENKCSMTDKITDYIKQTLETPKVENSPQPQGENHSFFLFEKDTVENKNNNTTEERLKTLEQKFSEVLDHVKALDETVSSQNEMGSMLSSNLGEVNQALKQIDKKLTETDQKFGITGKLIESAMNAIEQTGSAEKCEDDLKGIAVLKGNTT